MNKYLFLYKDHDYNEVARVVISDNITNAILDQFEYLNEKPEDYIKNALKKADTIDDTLKLYNRFTYSNEITKIIEIEDKNIIYWTE
jgi:hypothetical protein